MSSRWIKILLTIKRNSRKCWTVWEFSHFSSIFVDVFDRSLNLVKQILPLCPPTSKLLLTGVISTILFLQCLGLSVGYRASCQPVCPELFSSSHYPKGIGASAVDRVQLLKELWRSENGAMLEYFRADLDFLHQFELLNPLCTCRAWFYF